MLSIGYLVYAPTYTHRVTLSIIWIYKVIIACSGQPYPWRRYNGWYPYKLHTYMHAYKHTITCMLVNIYYVYIYAHTTHTHADAHTHTHTIVSRYKCWYMTGAKPVPSRSVSCSDAPNGTACYLATCQM